MRRVSIRRFVVMDMEEDFVVPCVPLPLIMHWIDITLVNETTNETTTLMGAD